MEGRVRINSNKREKTSTKHTLLLLNIYSVIIHKTMYILLIQQTGLYIYIYIFYLYTYTQTLSHTHKWKTVIVIDFVFMYTKTSVRF